MSFTFIKRRIKETSLNKWQAEYRKSKKGRFYQQFEDVPKWKAFPQIKKK